MAADNILHEAQTITEGVLLRPIRAGDDPAMARIIRSVMTEFGAVGKGFSIQDPEVDHMYKAYQQARACYFVLESSGAVIGGAGIAPLAGADPDTCELRKMYMGPATRGQGLGRAMMDRCMAAAVRLGFRTCYLETLASMHQAQRLYEKFGFRPVDAPMGATGHFGCDRWYTRHLVRSVSEPYGEREIDL